MYELNIVLHTYIQVSTLNISYTCFRSHIDVKMEESCIVQRQRKSFFPKWNENTSYKMFSKEHMYFNPKLFRRSSTPVVSITLHVVGREYVTSYTRTMLMDNERHETLREGFIMLCSELQPMDGPLSVIRTDPAPGFVALVNDTLLLQHRITIEIGCT